MTESGYRIGVDLTELYTDIRSKSFIYLQHSKLNTISDLEQHIKCRFDIECNIFLSTNGYFLPSAESTLIIAHGDIVKVIPNKEPGSATDYLFIKPKNSSKSEHKRKKRAKKDQTNHGQDFNNELDSSVLDMDSIQLENRSNLKTDGDIVEKLVDDCNECDTEISSGEHSLNDTKVKKRRKHEKLDDGSSLEQGVSEVNGSKRAKRMNGRDYENVQNGPQPDVSETEKRKSSKKEVNINLVAYQESSSSSDLDDNTAEQNQVKELDRKCKKVNGLQKEFVPVCDRSKDGNITTEADNASECSFKDTEVDRSRRRKRIRIRHRKKKQNKSAESIFSSPVSVSFTKQPNTGSTSKIRAPLPLKHTRFTYDDEDGDNTNKEYVSQTNAYTLPLSNTLPGDKQKENSFAAQIGSDTEGKMYSLVTKWDVIPSMKRESPTKINTGTTLTLDEVISKTLSPRQDHSTARVFECQKTVLLSRPKLEDNGINILSTITSSSSPLQGLPHENDVIAFKMLRLTEDYTPQLSEYITAKVLCFCPTAETVTVQMLNGHEQLQQPQGRFHLEDELVQKNIDIIDLNWKEILEPRLLFP